MVAHARVLCNPEQTVPFLCGRESTAAEALSRLCPQVVVVFAFLSLKVVRHLHCWCCAGVINYVTPEDTDYPEIDPEDKALRDAAVSVIKTHLLLRTPPDLDLTPAEIAQGMSSILEKHKNLEKNCSQFSVVATDVLRVWREKNPELDPTGMRMSRPQCGPRVGQPGPVREGEPPPPPGARRF